MSKTKKPYYFFLHDKNRNESVHETYFETNQFEWAKNIEDNFALIEKEMNYFLESNASSFEPYFATEMMNQPNKWQTIGFAFWGLRDKKNCEKCPETLKLFSKIPGFVSLSISKMEPHSEIKPHFGDTDAIYRCHLPLRVPGKLPDIGFHVGYEQRNWEKGKLMIFNDAAYHKAWNHTDQPRIILMIDIIRPEYLDDQIQICSLVIGSLTQQKFLPMKIKKKESIFNKMMIAIFTFPYFIFYSVFVRNRFNQKRWKA